MTTNELFTEQDWKNSLNAYTNPEIPSMYNRWNQLLERRGRSAEIGHMDIVFFGDSITNGWRLRDYFPHHSILNSGMPGDSVHGLWFRMEEDVFPYTPKKVFLLCGINGIQMDEDLHFRKLDMVASAIKEKTGAKVCLGSILPLHYPDNWDRFQYQDRIVRLNERLKEAAGKKYDGFVDYHTAVKDAKGELDAEFSRPDGTHINERGYRRMAETVRSFLEEPSLGSED